MADIAAKVRTHAFVSYSRADQESVDRLIDDLEERGVPLWVDRTGIEPGTPNWEASIREALHKAFAVVVAGTPNTAPSRFIHAELTLAEAIDVPVVPAWISGTAWSHCIHLGFLNAQYVDCREGQYEAGVDRLARHLLDLLDRQLPRMFPVDSVGECPPGCVPVLIPDGAEPHPSSEHLAHFASFTDPRSDRPPPPGTKIVAVNPRGFANFEDLLNELYTRFLGRRYAPYTYGEKWALAKPSSFASVFALPWQWLRERHSKPISESLPGHFRGTTPSDFGFAQERSYDPEMAIWAIVESGFDKCRGLFTDDDSVAKSLFDRLGKRFMLRMMPLEPRWDAGPQAGTASPGLYRPDQLDPEAFRHRFVTDADPFRYGPRIEGTPDDVVVVM